MPTIRLPIHLFQFTPLREGRQPKRGIRWQTMNFNSRPSARGDINRLQASQSSMYFNSRPSARGDAPFFAVSVADNHFNSRPSARGDPKFREAYIRAFISIHAPPRGATFPIPAFPKSCLISIHAPPRGATCGRPPSPQSGRPISIHAPPRGATLYQRETTPLQVGFQFTPLREGRRPFRGREVLFRRISIHAPPRGATRRPKFFQSPRPISIHAPPRGATHQKHFEEENTIFQFTPLREGRHRLGKRGFSRAYFNSRPSARGDRQHEAKYAYRRYFNSRPSARGDIPHGAPALQPRYFNSRPSARGDANVQPLLLGNKFQFTPLREGRHARCV